MRQFYEDASKEEEEIIKSDADNLSVEIFKYPVARSHRQPVPQTHNMRKRITKYYSVKNWETEFFFQNSKKCHGAYIGYSNHATVYEN